MRTVARGGAPVSLRLLVVVIAVLLSGVGVIWSGEVVFSSGPGSRCLHVEHGGDDPNVPAELEDQVLELGRSDGTHRRQLCGGLLVVEHVERPIADAAALQMGVEKSEAVVGADDERLDAGGLLVWP